MKKILLLALMSLVVSGCAQYSLVSAGTQKVGDLTVNPQSEWSKAANSGLGPKTILWTKDGSQLNRLVFFNGIANGKSIYTSYSRELPLPKFRTDMLPNELAELVEGTIRNRNGGKVDARTSNLRPQKVGEEVGFRFDLAYTNVDGLDKAGEVVAITKSDKLYMIMFDAAALHYQPKDAREIDAIFSNLLL